MQEFHWIGIDYGSKTAGTTVIAYLQETGAIGFAQSKKKQDADQFVLDWVSKCPVLPSIFLDAPLSLPLAYRDPGQYTDYFYRAADREVGAMSPMFLGGLTARAMRLHRTLQEQGCQVYEVYPACLAREWNLKEIGYKQQQMHLGTVQQALAPYLPFPVAAPVANWHQLDALLAFLSGYRFSQNRHLTFGQSEEGCIIV